MAICCKDDCENDVQYEGDRCELCHAWDAIEALTAERDQLAIYNDEIGAKYNGVSDALDAVEAERDALKAALRELVYVAGAVRGLDQYKDARRLLGEVE